MVAGTPLRLGSIKEVEMKAEHSENKREMKLSEVGFLELSYMETEIAFTCGLLFALGDIAPSTAWMGRGEDPWIPSELSRASNWTTFIACKDSLSCVKICSQWRCFVLKLQNHRTVGWKGPLKVQAPCSEQEHLHIDKKKVTKPQLFQNQAGIPAGGTPLPNQQQ